MLRPRRHQAQGKETDGQVTPNAVPSGYGPADLRSAYNITANGTTTIAIVDAYGYGNAEQDLAVYRAQYGLPACTTANGCFKKVNQNGVQGSYPAQNTGWAQEQALDLDMASAMCPNCKIVLVQATSATFANLAAARQHGRRDAGVDRHLQQLWRRRGRLDHATSRRTTSRAWPSRSQLGDSGYGVQFPASSPHVIAVGGTHLVRAANARGWSETAWSGRQRLQHASTPSRAGRPTRCAPSAWKPTSRRSAIPNTGVAVYGPTSRNSSAWLVFGGTSVSAPLIGGIYGVTGHGAANGAASIYAMPASLNDVTSGSNGSCGGTYFCTAGAGYDGPTGSRHAERHRSLLSNGRGRSGLRLAAARSFPYESRSKSCTDRQPAVIRSSGPTHSARLLAFLLLLLAFGAAPAAAQQPVGRLSKVTPAQRIRRRNSPPADASSRAPTASPRSATTSTGPPSAWR